MMNLLQGKIRTVYVKYLAAAFGSAMISSIYGLVDMAMVGQYQGAGRYGGTRGGCSGVEYHIQSGGCLRASAGRFCLPRKRTKGVGSGQCKRVFYSRTARYRDLCSCQLDRHQLFDSQLLTLFGAEETLLPLARRYLLPVKFAVPLFLFNQMLAAFLRNDGNPGLATAGVLAGGIFNIAGDYIFVFAFDMGIFGAGLATALGALITFLVMGTHFLQRDVRSGWFGRHGRRRNCGVSLSPDFPHSLSISQWEY